jgi:hypothetical protein
MAEISPYPKTKDGTIVAEAAETFANRSVRRYRAANQEAEKWLN